ncbi:hypothetical protein ACIQCR_10610 [Streptomyces sp. NPDC093249]|uniref:hypothetical protein n=1 Tax=unclassified Streptomyces TaxID=2593676 RepID=UPI0038129B9B
MTSSEAGEDGRARAKQRRSGVHQQVHEGIETADFVTMINVPRRMVADLGGDGNLPA